MKRAMDALRARLGPPPRHLDPELAAASALAESLPPWLTAEDGLRHQVDLHAALLAEGHVALGALLMANTALWTPGDSDAPAGVVYSFDPTLESAPRRLHVVCQRLYAFHERQEPPPRPPWQRAHLDELYTGFERPLHSRVDPALTMGHVVYHTSLLVFRDHLPGRHLTGRLMPLLVLRDTAPHPAMIVPAALWPAELHAAWRGDA